MNVSLAQRPPRFLHILLLGVALWGGEYARRGLWEPDEARCAYVAGEMSRTGQWAVPHRHGEPYAHKPPLMYWLINLGSLAAGGRITRVTARLPSLLGATLSLWCTARLAGRWWGPAAAWRSALILASTYLFWHEGGMGRMDALLCGLEMGALCCLFESHDARPFRRRAGAYALMGLAVLAKGPVGFLVPAGVYAAGTWAAGEGRRLRSWHWLWGPLVTLTFPAAWLIWARLAGAPGAYFREILYSQNVERAAGAWGHVQSPLYFLWHFPLDFLPWTPLLPAAWAALRGRPDATPLRRRLLAWALVVIGVFSLSPSKRSVYILAAFPAGALLIAAAWEHLGAKRHAAAACAAAAEVSCIVIFIIL